MHGPLVEELRSEWLTWFSMISRCHFEGDAAYDNYGGRGITVCERWRTLDGFKTFFADMGSRPQKDLSLERIDNDKGYSPENCKWATRQEQARNRRSNRVLVIDGVSAPVATWAEKSGVSRKVITDRLDAGWDHKRAVFTPRREDDVLAPGAVFEAWTVLGVGPRSRSGAKTYLCRCSCGREKTVRGCDLKRGYSTRCRSCSLKGNQHACGIGPFSWSQLKKLVQQEHIKKIIEEEKMSDDGSPGV